MIFWIVCALLTALGIILIIRPLLRHASPHCDGKETEVAIYYDQLQEIDRDLERNLIDTEEAKAAKLEVSRRLLAADAAISKRSDMRAETQSSDKLPNKVHEHLAMVLAVVIVVFTMGGYLLVGSPGLPSLPYAERVKADPASIPIGELIARVETRLRENPDDARGWDVIAPIYLRQEKYAKAVQAFQRAIQLNGESEKRLAQYAEAMLGANNGDVSDAVASVYRRFLKLRPDDLVAHFWLAVGHEQQNHPEQAVSGYRQLLTRQDLPPAMRQLISNRIAALGGQISPPAQPVPDDSGKVAAPSQEARQEMASLSLEERQKRIKAMVDSLASRLREDGGELSEWQRLIRVFSVLGKTEEAKQAYRDALRAFKDKPQEIQSLNTFAAQLGIAAKASEN